MNIYFLFVIAALDKFSFNAIRALLVLYLVKYFHLLDAQAYQNYFAVMTLAFMAPLICGYLTDKFKDAQKILLFSCLWSMVGLLLLLISNIQILYVALAVLIIASGFLKTVIPALIADCGREKKINKDALFAKLYFSFNVGSLLGTLGCSVIGEVYGWRYGFMIAAIAMLSASILSFFCTKAISNNNKGKDFFQFNGLFIIVGILFFAILNLPFFLSGMLYTTFFISLGILVYLAANSTQGSLKNIIYLIYLMITHTIFFALYEQSSLLLTLFTDRAVDRSLSHFLPYFFEGSTFIMPVTFFQTVDPLFNILFGAAFIATWTRIAKRYPNFSYVGKFCIGLLFISTAFFILGISKVEGETIAAGALMLTYSFFVLGEQFVVPIGFSAVATLSPKDFLAYTMGVWYISIALSESLAVQISQSFYSGSIEQFSVSDYQQGFLNLALVIAGVTLSLFLIYYFLRRLPTFKISIDEYQ